MTDPFNIVKEELKRSVNKTKSIIESYNVLAINENSNDTSLKMLTDIRTNLKSINWDIQDLEETINIASKNPAKFNLSDSDIENRRQFINTTREFVKKTKKTYSIELDDSNLVTVKKSAQSNVSIKVPDIISNASAKSKNYTKLENLDSDDEIDTRKPTKYSSSNANNQNHSIQMQHEKVFKDQDKNLELISGRVSSLKNISQTMQNELEDQAFLLDDLGREMDTTESRLGTVTKKITKVLHMSSDKRQWTLICVLIGAIVFLLFLLIIL